MDATQAAMPSVKTIKTPSLRCRDMLRVQIMRCGRNKTIVSIAKAKQAVAGARWAVFTLQ